MSSFVGRAVSRLRDVSGTAPLVAIAEAVRRSAVRAFGLAARVARAIWRGTRAVAFHVGMDAGALAIVLLVIVIGGVLFAVPLTSMAVMSFLAKLLIAVLGVFMVIFTSL